MADAPHDPIAPPHPIGRKKRGEGATRRAEILAAARRLFLEEGYEHATMRRIAAAVGVSSTALYVYFQDKEAILRAIAEDTFRDLLATLEASQQGIADPLERFRAGLLAYVAFGRARPDEYRLTFLAKMMASPGPGRVCHDIEAADRSFAILEGNLAELVVAGLFAPAPPLLVAEAVWAALHGLTTLLLDQESHLESPPELLAEAMIDIILRGLLIRPSI